MLEMKQIVICLILGIGILAAADDNCNENWIKANQKYYKCAGEYSDDFTYWLMKFLDYGEFNSTNLDDVSLKSTAICEKFALHVKCVEIRLVTIGENCTPDFLLNEQIIVFKRTLLNYFCVNEAQKLRDALVNNVCSSITSGNFNFCMADIDGVQLVNDIDGIPILNVGYVCSSLNRVFTCLKSKVDTAQNKNLKNILQELFTIIHDMFQCSTN